jgi:PAS domain-containing protein
LLHNAESGGAPDLAGCAGQEVILLALFHAFSTKCSQIQRAIRIGDDVLVESLDKELEPLVTAILAFRASNVLEIYMQLQFVSNLIRREADDRSSVVQHCAALSTLMHRYFAGADEAAMDVLLSFCDEKPDHRGAVFRNDDVLSDVVLDCLPDRVAVITRDYRYLYSNAANCEYLDVKPVDLIGRHLSEFIGIERFEQRAKHKLDACFAGEAIDYVYKSYFTFDAGKAMRCRMTPLRGAKGEIIGALLTLQDARISAEVLA